MFSQWNRGSILRLLYKFILIQAVFLGLANGSLVLLGQNDFALFFILSSIVYLIISLFFLNLDHRYRVFVDIVSMLIFINFCIILTYRILNTL